MSVGPKVSSPTAPIIFTEMFEEFDGEVLRFGRERRAHATAWLAPFPPGPVVNEEPVRVSPPDGTRGVIVTRSMLREPIIVMILSAILKVGSIGRALKKDSFRISPKPQKFLNLSQGISLTRKMSPSRW